jgi:sigma-B regulation protein RsbU (phosphoserine phosphatase)
MLANRAIMSRFCVLPSDTYHDFSMASQPDSASGVQRFPALSIYDAPWQKRLELIVETMREMSRQSDPQLMVQAYGRRMWQIMGYDRLVGLSRRNLPTGKYKITRSTTWTTPVNPWKSPEKLPILEGGLLGELIGGEKPVIIDDLNGRVVPDDPGAEYLVGMGSLQAIPNFDQGHALNMTVIMCEQPRAFRHEYLPEHVWMSNLFGRATYNLVLSDQVKRLYDAAERENRIIADIQRSLLPTQLPEIPGLDLAAHYQTSRQAGGDYYDFFPLPNGRWGILIADVSGHGTPAAVLMAVTQSIAHTGDGIPDPPSKLLTFLNHHLSARYTNGNGTFVTAFYGIYDPHQRTLTYARAGHGPPRVKHDGSTTIDAMDRAPSLPLGIEADEIYQDSVYQLRTGDTVIFYTDGITESRAPRTRELFGIDRLDAILADGDDADCESIIRSIMIAVEDFTDDSAPSDDMTLLVARVR